MVQLKKYPLVTIGMPVWNCAGTVGEAIASILNQTLEDWELVVVDDGSQDGTAEVARRFDDKRVRVAAGGRNRGLPARLNEMVREARGVYFARMDGDDVAYPERLLRQVEFLEAHAEVDVVGGAMLVFGAEWKALGVRRGPREHEQICARPAAGFKLAHSTWTGRTEWFRQHAYREDAVRMEDWELLYRAHGESQFANLEEIVLGYREESLDLGKIGRSRWNKCRFVAEYARRDGRFAAAAGEAGLEAAKFAVDALAVGTGLKHRLLRHRAGPMTPAEAEEWRAVKRAASTLAAEYGRERVPA